MNVTAAPKSFQPVSLVFNNQAELHDFIAALAAYGQNRVNVSGSDIQKQYKLTAYTGNARRTVKNLLPQLTAAL